MDKRTKAVLTVITVCLAIQIDPRTTVASEIDANTKEVTEARFFDPSEDTKYVGRLLSLSESYPLMKMMKLCEAYTGLDTAQVKCQKISGADGYVCEYKCSKHWLADGGGVKCTSTQIRCSLVRWSIGPLVHWRSSIDFCI